MAFAELGDQFPDLSDLDRVEAHGGFIQYDDLRRMQDCLGDTNALLKALGKVTDQSLANAGQSATLFCQCHGVFDSGFFNASEHCAVTQVLIHAHFLI